MPDAANQKPILPRPVDGSIRPSAPLLRTPDLPAQFRKSVRVACNNCRIKKVACDANRPQCAQCVKRNVECLYVTANANETPIAAVKRAHANVKKDYDDLSELIDRLRLASEADCEEILKSLRANLRPLAILANLRGVRPENIQLVIPQTNRGMAGKSTSIPAAEEGVGPGLSSSLGAAGVATNYNIAGDGITRDPQLLSDYTSASSQTPLGSGAVPMEPDPADLPALGGLEVETYGPALDPHSVPAYDDQRLQQLQISHWTNIPISNEFAANAISFCIESNRHVLGLLNRDLFMQDLVYLSDDSCSSLLVNSLLSWALRAYIGIVPNMSEMSVAFFQAAQHLWIDDRLGDSVPSMSALGILGINEDFQGSTIDGGKWRMEAQRMAERLDLISPYGKSADDTSLIGSRVLIETSPYT